MADKHYVNNSGFQQWFSTSNYLRNDDVNRVDVVSDAFGATSIKSTTSRNWEAGKKTNLIDLYLKKGKLSYV